MTNSLKLNFTISRGNETRPNSLIDMIASKTMVMDGTEVNLIHDSPMLHRGKIKGEIKVPKDSLLY